MSPSGGPNPQKQSPAAENSKADSGMEEDADIQQQIGSTASSAAAAAFLADLAEIKNIPMGIHHQNPKNIPAETINDPFEGVVDSFAATPPLKEGREMEEPNSAIEEGEEEAEEYSDWMTRQLGELKVQDLKNECKKRQLAVSGSKQQLIDRLRPFERQIVGQPNNNNSSPPPPPQHSSSPPSLLLHQQQQPPLLPTICPSNSAPAAAISSSSSSSSAVIDAVIDSVIDGTGLMEGATKRNGGGNGGKSAGIKRAKNQNNNKLMEWKGTTMGTMGKCKGGGKLGVRKQREQNGGTLADLLRGGALPFGHSKFGCDGVFGIGKKGANFATGCCGCGENVGINIGGGGKKQRIGPPKWPTGRRNRRSAAATDPLEADGGGNEENATPPSTILMGGHSPHLPAAAPTPQSGSSVPQPFETMTFSFAQMGSGGQFTPMEPADINLVDIPTAIAEAQQQNDGTHLAQQNGEGNNNKKLPHPCLAPILLPNLASASKINGAIQQGKKECRQCTSKGIINQPHAFLTPQPHPMPSAKCQIAAINPFICANSDQFEEGNALAGAINRRRHSTQLGELCFQQQQGAWAGEEAAAELMSATTLARHEECLRQQQRKIHDLQRELARSQLGLQQHQQMLAEARTSTALARDPETGRLVGQMELWLGQLEAGRRQLERANRDQTGIMERQIAAHRTLVCAEQKLQEELHTDQAVQDICRLIRQEPKAALLIVQLLRRYQLERSSSAISSTGMVASSASSPSLPPPIAPPVPQMATPLNGEPTLWNGFLPAPPPPSKSIQCHHHWPSNVPSSNGGDGQKGSSGGGRKRPSGALKGDSAGKRRGGASMAHQNHQQQPAAPSMGRSNSVLDGMTTASACGPSNAGRGHCGGAGCWCPLAAVARRPNSSLGTSESCGVEGEGGHLPRQCMGGSNIDMEEIFRSVLEGGEAGDERNGDSQMEALALESPQKHPSPQFALDHPLHHHQHPHHPIIPSHPIMANSAIPVHSFVPIPADFVATTPQSAGGAAAAFLDSCPTAQMFVDSSSHQQQQNQQEMEKTMQDLMEVLRDDQEKGGSVGDENANNSGDCPSTDADFQTDQLATFLAEEVELCRTANGAAANHSSASAIFPAPVQSLAAMAVGSIRLHQQNELLAGNEGQNADGLGFGGTSPAADSAQLIFACPEEAEKAMDWLDGFDPFTAVF